MVVSGAGHVVMLVPHSHATLVCQDCTIELSSAASTVRNIQIAVTSAATMQMTRHALMHSANQLHGRVVSQPGCSSLRAMGYTL